MHIAARQKQREDDPKQIKTTPKNKNEIEKRMKKSATYDFDLAKC